MLQSMSPRQVFLFVFVSCAGLMAYALYAQYVQNYEPCMLCMVQRFFMCLLGAVALIAAIHNPARAGVKIYGTLAIGFAALGAYIAARHVYLQSLPPHELAGCSPGIEFMLNNFDWLKILQTVFIRDQDCGKIDWVFLGMSMPRWVLLWFVGMAVLLLWSSFRKPAKARYA
jgi:protein dithiol:quinone oxidoreductase